MVYLRYVCSDSLTQHLFSRGGGLAGDQAEPLSRSLPFKSLQAPLRSCYIARLHFDFSQGEASLELVTEETALLRLREDSLKVIRGFQPIRGST
jgi:hypothetical protein